MFVSIVPMSRFSLSVILTAPLWGQLRTDSCAKSGFMATPPALTRFPQKKKGVQSQHVYHLEMSRGVISLRHDPSKLSRRAGAVVDPAAEKNEVLTYKELK